jgi:hypothetical protein
MIAPNGSTSVIELATTSQFHCVTAAETKKGSFGSRHSKLPLGRGGEDIQQSESSFIVIEEPT